jgi:hypothetical protein
VGQSFGFVIVPLSNPPVESCMPASGEAPFSDHWYGGVPPVGENEKLYD